jgi:hypothetical protein
MNYMHTQTITKEKNVIERILLKQKQDVLKSINEWRKRNKKYFRAWDSAKVIRALRESNGRP